MVAGEAGRLHLLVGRVFDACDAAKAPAHDNRTAIGRALTAVLRSCADSLREARELTDGRSCAEADEQRSSAADVDFEAEECTPQVCSSALLPPVAMSVPCRKSPLPPSNICVCRSRSKH